MSKRKRDRFINLTESAKIDIFANDTPEHRSARYGIGGGRLVQPCDPDQDTDENSADYEGLDLEDDDKANHVIGEW